MRREASSGTPEDHDPTIGVVAHAGEGASASVAPVLNWPVLAPHTNVGERAALVVAAVLHCEESRLAAVEQVLSGEERERARRFHLPGLRRRFVVSRGVLREVLALHAGCLPGELRFHAGPQGKPMLAGHPHLHFNLAHSAEVMLLAVSSESELGVDVERVRAMKEAEALARRFFTAREAAWLAAQTAAVREEAFFRLWTRKEAVLKACGQGIAHGLDRLQLVNSLQELVGEVRFPEPTGQTWHITPLYPAAGYLGAVAASQAREQVHCYSWAPDSPSPHP